MFKTILVANDGSDRAFDALALALKIAKQGDADLRLNRFLFNQDRDSLP
jgi:nucleotide-binding universal stress UspA family protein